MQSRKEVKNWYKKWLRSIILQEAIENIWAILEKLLNLIALRILFKDVQYRLLSDLF